MTRGPDNRCREQRRKYSNRPIGSEKKEERRSREEQGLLNPWNTEVSERGPRGYSKSENIPGKPVEKKKKRGAKKKKKQTQRPNPKKKEKGKAHRDKVRLGKEKISTRKQV